MDLTWEEIRRRYVIYNTGNPLAVNASVSITVPDYTKCSGDIQQLTTSVSGGTAPYTYLWSPSTGLSSTTSANPTASHSSTITYTVVVTDANGLTASDTTIVTVPAAVGATVSTFDGVSCFGGSDGSATVTATNGLAPYTYLWHNGTTTAAITNLSSGNYGVTVSDSCGATAYAIAYITQPADLSVTTTVDNNLCYAGTDGAATASVSGGTAPYNYSWSNGATAAHITGLTAGVFVVTVTDDNGCSKTQSATITQPAQYTSLTTTITGSASILSGGIGGMSASVTNGRAPYTYSWSPTYSLSPSSTSGNPTASPTQSTVYTVVTTDACGITGSATHSMSVTDRGAVGTWEFENTWAPSVGTYSFTTIGADMNLSNSVFKFGGYSADGIHTVGSANNAYATLQGCPLSVTASVNFTVSFWTRFSALQTTNGRADSLINMTGPLQRNIYLNLTRDAGVQKLNIGTWNGTSGTSNYVNWTPTLNQWYHIVWIQNGANHTTYVDNSVMHNAVSVAASGVVGSTTGYFAIGDVAASVNNLVGYMDRLKIDQRVWSASEVAAEYNMPS